jgi:hypothetical protein
MNKTVQRPLDVEAGWPGSHRLYPPTRSLLLAILILCRLHTTPHAFEVHAHTRTVSIMLTQVDKLEFLVLVDNCKSGNMQSQRHADLITDVEWMSTLPPGFVYELPQHLMRPPPHGPPQDPMSGLPFLDLDNFCCGAHGLSIFIVRFRPPRTVGSWIPIFREGQSDGMGRSLLSAIFSKSLAERSG